MKYIILSAAAVAAVFIVCFGAGGFIRKKSKKKLPLPVHIFICLLCGAVVLSGTAAVFLEIHYSASGDALEVLQESSDVRFTEINGAYFADGPGEKNAMIFYPGAKVDPEAYLPLIKKIADDGIDCFIIRPPFRFALFAPDAAESIMKGYKYDKWLLSGHSMGGIVASSYAAGHSGDVDGVVLLASYPTEKLDESINVLSVYGSEDKVFDISAYERAKAFLPENYKELVIDGGNHSGFGNYGAQSGDGEARISAEEQQLQTAFEIKEFVEGL